MYLGAIERIAHLCHRARASHWRHRSRGLPILAPPSARLAHANAIARAAPVGAAERALPVGASGRASGPLASSIARDAPGAIERAHCPLAPLTACLAHWRRPSRTLPYHRVPCPCAPTSECLADWRRRVRALPALPASASDRAPSLFPPSHLHTHTPTHPPPPPRWRRRVRALPAGASERAPRP